MTWLKRAFRWYAHLLSKAMPYHEWVCAECMAEHTPRVES